MVVSLVSLVWLVCWLPSPATAIRCYSCHGKKGECQVWPDPGQEKECPSLHSLIRPSVLLSLDGKWSDLAGRRDGRTLRAALLETYRELYATIPSFAVLDQVQAIPDLPSYEDILTLNAGVWKGIRSKCAELGCKYSRKLEKDYTILDRKWNSVSAKKNQLSMTNAVRSSFNNLGSVLPAAETTEVTANLTRDMSKQELLNLTEAVLAALDADCAAGSCTYTADIRTEVEAKIETRWTAINSRRTAASLAAAVETAFSDLTTFFVYPDAMVVWGENNGNMTENTTLLEVKATAELLWQNFSSDCENSDCGIAAPDTVITALETDWTDGQTVAEIRAAWEAVQTGYTAAYSAHFTGLADTAIAALSLADTTTWSELQQAGDTVLAAVSAACRDANCSFTAAANDSIQQQLEVGWLALSPTEVELRGALDAALAVLRAQFYAHFSTLVSDSLDLAVAPIVDNTTWSELENITATVLADLEVECANGSCAFSPLLRSTVLAELDTNWAALSVNREDAVLILNNAFGEIYQALQTGQASPLVQRSAAILPNTTFEQLVNISDEALLELIGSGPDNGCTYQKKTVVKILPNGKKKVKLQLDKSTDPNNATICKADLCNKKGLYTCLVCTGPNNICKKNELGVSTACQSEEQYCIKELSGDITNRELVARRCGTEFDREATCGSSGDNIGIAASGLVRCCSNREEMDCNRVGSLPGPATLLLLLLLLLTLTGR